MTLYPNGNSREPNPNYIPPASRKAPTYDWDWFESHTPFKSILERTCSLEIEKEVQKIPTIAGCYTTNNHYKIRYNQSVFERDFDNIKSLLLNTNICKKNKDVFDFVNEMDCSKRNACRLIMYGCIKNVSGSFEWDDMSNT
mgnify:CR=1 FL=1